MTFRVLALVVGATCTAPLPARAQSEARSRSAGSLPISMRQLAPRRQHARLRRARRVNAFSFLALEVDIASASRTVPAIGRLHVWLVYDVPTTSRAEVFAGIGFVRNTYTGAYKAKDSGVGGQVGVRQKFGKILAIRVDGHADFMPAPRTKSYLVSYNGNWGFGVGVSALLNR